MLDCKMNSTSSTLSPVTPVNSVHQESYMGIWDQEGLNSHPTKLNDMIDMLEPSLAHSTTTHEGVTSSSSPTTTIHHGNNQSNPQNRGGGDCHFQSSQYLTPLPNLGGDPYSNSTECPQIDLIDGFQCPSTSDNGFHIKSETPPNFCENYDTFISNFDPPHHHHPHHQNGSSSGGSNNNSLMLHHTSGDGSGQCSPGCLACSSSPSPFQNSQNNHHSHNSHHNNHHHNHQLNLNNSDPLAGGGGSLGHHNHLDHHQHNHHNHHQNHQPHQHHPSSNSSSHQAEYIWDDLTCDPGEYLFLPKGDSPTTSDSINSYNTDIDSEMESKSFRGSLSLAEICHVSPPKRKVGRPPKKDKKLKRNEKKTGRLWEFIRDLLKNPEYCPSLVRWENPEEGHFRFVNSEKVAQLWGSIKGNPRMTYEKLSRAMRYYYKSHVFEPVLGRRLVYKFGYNAVNWKPINPNFVSIQKLYSN